MNSPSDTRRDSQIRIYDRGESVVFLRTAEEFGGLSNMAGGFPLLVNNLHILTSEALYQACRFPHFPEIQQLIIAQASPMTAKMKGKPYRRDSRPDWNQVRVKIMRWCLRVKLAQNWFKFGELLLATGSRPIVEASRKDDFWGAKPVDDRTLVGMNVLGRLLMELREEVKSGAYAAPMRVEPLPIPDFLLNGQPIQPVIGRSESEQRRSAQRSERERRILTPEPSRMAVQVAMFDWNDRDRVHRLITEDIPARVAADPAYQNAKQSSDPQNARIEHDKALSRVMNAVLKEDTELFKQFVDNESFRHWLSETVFRITYDRPASAP